MEVKFFKNWIGHPGELKREGLPPGWHEVTKAHCMKKLENNVELNEKELQEQMLQGHFYRSFNAYYIAIQVD